jgi:hypothetical protein
MHLGCALTHGLLSLYFLPASFCKHKTSRFVRREMRSFSSLPRIQCVGSTWPLTEWSCMLLLPSLIRRPRLRMVSNNITSCGIYAVFMLMSACCTSTIRCATPSCIAQERDIMGASDGVRSSCIRRAQYSAGAHALWRERL